jgi:signal transduction histidine kinase
MAFLLAFDSAAVAFEMFVVHIYLKAFLEKRAKKFPGILGYAVFGAALVSLSLLFPNMFLMLSVTFSGVLAMSFILFAGPAHSRFFAAMLFCFLAAVSEILSSLIVAEIFTAVLGEVHEYGGLRIISSILSNLIRLLVIKIMGVFIRQKAGPKLQHLWEVTPLLLFLLFSIYLLIFRFYDTYIAFGTLPARSVFEILFIAYMNIVAFRYYDGIVSKHESRHEREVMALRTESMMKYYELVKKQQDALTAIRHDIKRHMGVMESIVAASDQAENYFNSYRGILKETGHIVVTPNPVVSVILSDCVSRAAALDVEPAIEIDLPKDFSFDPVDVTTILGNTIDNALRALAECPESKERNISILLRRRGNFIFYEISNTYASMPPASRVGYGLRNVRACAAKYNGEVNITDGGGIYTVVVILQNRA